MTARAHDAVSTAFILTIMLVPSLPTPLVSTGWLAAHLLDDGVRILDASMYLPSAGRDSAAEYAAEHIPGSVFADIVG